MKRQTILFAMLFAFTAGALACTNFIVGKKASVNGAVICSYSADSYGMFQGLVHYPAAKHPKGTMRQVYDWDTNKYGGEILEAEETYNVIGNINEWQLTIGETTFGGREEMVDTTGIIDYGSLIYITLQRAKTAREAIDVMTSLVEQYGYNSEGETFTICDPNEAWIMEMMGCASDRKVEKGRTVWVAVRIPDDMICGHANQSRITKFDMKDKENVRYSKNVVSYARKMGWFSGKDEDFSYNAAYAAPDFSGRRICDARVWTFFNRYAEGMDKYIPWAEGRDLNAEPMPLWVKPSKKLSVADVREAMRDHFENTPFALDSDIGGGIWEMPYRPTPLYY
ncbi:MAG: C69 family dipeptidase, partial [Prevotella sp.]|nr:C69 family dipeptidase [Prevotella sp.]